MQDTSGVHVWLVLVKAFHALAAHGPRRELGRLPACYFVCERNSVVRIRTQIGMSLEVPKRLAILEAPGKSVANTSLETCLNENL